MVVVGFDVSPFHNGLDASDSIPDNSLKIADSVLLSLASFKPLVKDSLRERRSEILWLLPLFFPS